MLYPEQDPEGHKTNHWKFIEVWSEIVSDTKLPSFLLLVCRSETKFEIISIWQKYATLYETDNYKDATYWLAEDEYVQVSERITPDY